MTSADALRKYLSENLFKIESETAVKDAGKLYTVIKAVYSGSVQPTDEAFLRIGLLRADTDAARQYIDKQIRIVKKCVEDLSAAGKDTEADGFRALLFEMEKRS